MTKKYKLSNKCEDGLYRIVALRDIPRYGVEADNWGGCVSGEHSLSQKGDCWIRYDARVFSCALICDDALVCDSAIIRGFNHTQTKVGGNTVISGTTCLNSGTWETTPKVIYGSSHDVIYNDKQIAIGCECHPLEWWEENGLEVAKKDEFTPKRIEEYRGHLNTIKKEYADDKEV